MAKHATASETDWDGIIAGDSGRCWSRADRAPAPNSSQRVSLFRESFADDSIDRVARLADSVHGNRTKAGYPRSIPLFSPANCAKHDHSLAGDTARVATTYEVKDLRRESRDLKEVVAEQTLELRLLKKSMIGDGGDQE